MFNVWVVYNPRLMDILSTICKAISCEACSLFFSDGNVSLENYENYLFGSFTCLLTTKNQLC